MGTTLMAPRKNNKRSKASMVIAKAIIEEYQPKNAEEMQDALKDIFDPMFEAMLQGEMDSHLGYPAHDHGYKETENRRNGYTHKNLKTSYGDISRQYTGNSLKSLDLSGKRKVRSSGLDQV